jgi:hypothetical protein
LSLFDELGIKPGQANITALRTELEFRRSEWNKPGYHYRGAGDFLLQHGRFWNGRQLPEQYLSSLNANPEGPTVCFANALLGAQTHAELTYVEGMYSTGHGHFTSHAWCMDPDGGIVELNLPTDPDSIKRMVAGESGMNFLPPQSWAYCGVPFPELKFVEWHDMRFGLPMFDRSKTDRNYADRLDVEESHDWPILKVPFDPTRKELP